CSGKTASRCAPQLSVRLHYPRSHSTFVAFTSQTSTCTLDALRAKKEALGYRSATWMFDAPTTHSRCNGFWLELTAHQEEHMSIGLQGKWQGRALVAALLGTWCVS